MKIDAHNHFWRYHPAAYPWITDELALLKRDYLPSEFQKVLAGNGLAGTVAVQAAQNEQETDFLLTLAEQHDFIRGVVGWVDLQSPQVGARLAHYAQNPKVKGMRHLVQDEADPAFMQRPAFMRGIAALVTHNLTYDILVFHHQLPSAIQLVEHFPNQKFVLDHLAKPAIAAGAMQPWARHVRALAAHENVWCKVSGMVTEADWQHWKPADFAPYLDVVFEAFGAGRILYGSDWPVCLLAADYGVVAQIVADYIAALSPAEQKGVWGGNATRFYGI